MRSKTIKAVFLLCSVMLHSRAVEAKTLQTASSPKPATTPVRRTPTSGSSLSGESFGMGNSATQKPLMISGQTRSMSALFTLKREKDQIKFGSVRENFKEEILKTNF